ncbi:L,D-transpeptidase family protein [Streptomyces laculatispora]|uniref:L,D-transpeptidase family protein n=1 Tax=Streptomyces laculatispora TaxID=887464 RepID=A0ABY9I6G0_9ACTN|nr:L,D-transpeptidase family protein [Streptomyces laculatispora]WLQ42071.1 L,D-transpeptidase family protein [Streptomyces laculatispora]
MSVPRSSVPLRLPYVVCAVFVLLLAACGTGGIGPRESGAPTRTTGAPGVPGPSAGGASAAGPAAAPPRASPAPPREIPGLGPRTRAAIPAGTRQVFVVTGESPDSSRSTAVLYTRDGPAADWRATAPWAAHNALNGWTAEHWEGDLRSPVGVYTLTAAGGRFDPPSTVFPYDLSPDFKVEGEGFHGEPLEGSFDYVIAIDYNRLPGTSPLDHTRPLGTERGGGIWIHVDHGGPTQGCVSISEDRMKELLSLLDPAKDPVVVMGDAAYLGG